MSSTAQADQAVALDRIIELVSADETPAMARQLATFAGHYTRRIAEPKLAERSPECWAAQLKSHFVAARKRLGDQRAVRVFNPQLATDGWDSRHTVVQIVNADMPFLVDSTTMAISEQQTEIHLIVHPVFRVLRDPGGYLMDLAPPDVELGGAHTESIMHFEISRLSEPQALAELRQRIERFLDDVALAVRDWRAMRKQLDTACEYLATANSPYDRASIDETVAFLRWLADDQFTLLGYREYRLSGGNTGALPETGLGILSKPDTHSPASIESPDPITVNEAGPLVITKTNARATVHRAGYMDYIGVMKFDDDGRLIGERRFLGLFTSSAYNRRPWNIPYVRRKVSNIMANSGFAETSHGGKALQHIMATLPRDELFQAPQAELATIVRGIYELQERQQTRLFVRPDQFGRFYSCLVYIPRDRFNTETRQRVQEVLTDCLGGDQLDFNVQIDDSALARLHVIVRVPADSHPNVNVAQIESELIEVVRSWHDRLTDVLIEKFGEEQGIAWARQYNRAFPAAYLEDVSPWVAAFDVENLAQLVDEQDLRLSLYRPRKRHVGLFRFKIFRAGKTIPLSDVLPMLENMGLRIVSERPYQLRMADGTLRWIQDFDMQLASGGDLPLSEIRDNFQRTFEQVVRGHAESDGFNRLVIGARLKWRQVAVLRAYCKYLLQTDLPFSQAYIERTVPTHPGIARLAVEYFEARFDPQWDLGAARQQLLVALREWFDPDRQPQLAELLETLSEARSRDLWTASLAATLRYAIDQVSSLDEDRILRAFVEAIAATLRTNAFQPGADDESKPYLSIKLDSSKVDELPKPRPWREIFVYSPRVEGIHLRGGAVARGGLRWSGRPEDFRTEVLGLMKAQVVKNTIIVPVGAKGGFVAKRLPMGGDRDAVMAEVVACYRLFINGLLDITDNLRQGELVYPTAVLRHDADDPYLVVAADKGTATFSDIANSVAQSRDFWLGDAFASGGSVGYDHKGMGITAKGAWESVKRHFRELGVDCQNEDISVVGIGDMSGDVFGNGMLLSEHIELVAAFNHLHIFFDPKPDPAASFAERQRLFQLSRSSWSDYDPALISEGGGVFARSEKSIPLSPQVRTLLGTKSESLAPNELIKLVLKAPVDLLWNGGIGTYVKASQESQAEVGDRANDVLRINGSELRCRVVGEGGNLGLTQLGRIEYALAGGRLNTDAIDNSAGVDCSDHEVNIKILLNDVMQGGHLSLAQRNQLLASMTDEVARLVLRNNYLQTQALTLMESWTASRLGSQSHMIDVLESRGALDRELEHLPNHEEIDERRTRSRGLTRPELSTLLAYSKITLYQDLLESDVPEDEYLASELPRYFPAPLGQYQDQMQQHRLRREIIVTAVTNSMVNRMGATFCLRMHEDTGADPAEIAKAYTAAREVFSVRRWWGAIQKADNRLSAARQNELQFIIWRLLRHITRWLLLHHRPELDIAALVERYQAGAKQLVKLAPSIASVAHGAQMTRLKKRFSDDEVEAKLAAELVGIPALNSTLDIVTVAHQQQAEVARVAELYYQIDKSLRLSWLLGRIDKLPVEGQWHAHARGGLRDALHQQHQRLAAIATADDNGAPAAAEVRRCFKRQACAVADYDHMLGDMKSGTGIDYATASVAVRRLEQLVQSMS